MTDPVWKEKSQIQDLKVLGLGIHRIIPSGIKVGKKSSFESSLQGQQNRLGGVQDTASDYWG